MMRIIAGSEFKLEREVDAGTTEQLNAVLNIVQRVRLEGDEALFHFTRLHDKTEVTTGNIRVTAEDIARAYELVEPSFLEAIREAAQRIRTFHEKQKRASWFDIQPDGTMLGQLL